MQKEVKEIKTIIVPVMKVNTVQKKTEYVTNYVLINAQPVKRYQESV